MAPMLGKSAGNRPAQAGASKTPAVGTAWAKGTARSGTRREGMRAKPK